MTEQEVADLVKPLAASNGAPLRGTLDHDFGPVLARGQVLTHEFTVVNTTDHPIRLRDSLARTPCCSAIGPLPEVIAPGATARLPVVLKAGHAHDRRRVEFVVSTDVPDHPRIVLTLAASFLGAWEVEPRPDPDENPSAGEPGHRFLRVTCRRLGDEGRGPPVAVEVAPPLTAAFLGPAAERRFEDGVIETIRDVAITLPATAFAGFHRADVTLRWEDGESRTHPVPWNVVPPIQVAPAGLFLRPGEGVSVHAVVVRSERRAFRVRRVSGDRLAEPVELPDGPDRVHRLRLPLDPTRPTAGGASDILIETDDPDHPRVAISVLVLAGEEGGTE